MDKKVYEKTRYQNIYRHKKNKNYLIMISKPVKSSIATIDGKKIMKLEDAIKIRDNPKLKVQKGLELTYKEDFDDIWNKYIEYCKNIKRLSYNTIKKKIILYNKYFKNEFTKRITKITKDDTIHFINNVVATSKQKNEMITILKAFFNWCIKEGYIIVSPMISINRFKVEKSEMKFWTPEELKSILNKLDEDIKNGNLDIIIKARRIKLFILIEFSLGDRVGETRALTYDCFEKKSETVKIKHSINYDIKSKDYLSHTKNYHSQREIDITERLLQEVENYKQFLINYTEYDIKDDDIIFYNYQRKKPYSDTVLRKDFNYYCDKANVTKIRMYDLRHTYVATMMTEGKELYHISSRIGHSNYSTTVNKYGHLSNKTRKEIAEITDKYI